MSHNKVSVHFLYFSMGDIIFSAISCITFATVQLSPLPIHDTSLPCSSQVLARSVILYLSCAGQHPSRSHLFSLVSPRLTHKHVQLTPQGHHLITPSRLTVPTRSATPSLVQGMQYMPREPRDTLVNCEASHSQLVLRVSKLTDIYVIET